MIIQCVPIQACLDFLKGVHLAAHTYKIALFTSAASLDETYTTYTTPNEVTGAGYTAGGQVLTGATSGSDSGGGFLDFTDPTWPGSTITARAAVIYNTSSTPANRVIAIIDFGSDKSSTAGDFTIAFPAPASATAIIRAVN